MTNQQHPITPPSELLDEWCMDLTLINWQAVATQAAQWGADMELEACGRWIEDQLCMPPDARADVITKLNGSRRPKPPSLKDQALQVLASAPGPDYPRVMTVLNADEHALIRQALEALPND